MLFKQVLAQQRDEYIPTGCEGCDIPRFSNITAVFVNFFMGTAIAVSIIGIILSGISFMTSQGDFKGIQKAKSGLTYSIVALILSIGGFTLRNTIIATLGGTVAGGPFDNPTVDF